MDPIDYREAVELIQGAVDRMEAKVDSSNANTTAQIEKISAGYAERMKGCDRCHKEVEGRVGTIERNMAVMADFVVKQAKLEEAVSEQDTAQDTQGKSIETLTATVGLLKAFVVGEAVAIISLVVTWIGVLLAD